MNCPNCGTPMEEGGLDSRSPIHWAESASGLSIPASQNDVILGKAFGILRPKAWLCRKCRMVITEY